VGQHVQVIEVLKIKIYLFKNMKKDIENQFLKAYKQFGVVSDCITVIRQRYDLGFLPAKNQLSEKWKEHYEKTLPNVIQAEADAFDNAVIDYADSPLFDEISNNLSECRTMQEKERYIHSLIMPFRELSELLHPEKAPKQRVENELKLLQKDTKFWEQQANSTIDGEAKEAQAQLQATEELINIRNDRYKRLEMISERFFEILQDPTDDVEKTLHVFWGWMFSFANQLDALLLQNGIDFMQMQEDCATYLKTDRMIFDIEHYVGGIELARKYIAELPTATEKSQQKRTKGIKSVEDYLTCKNKYEIMTFLHEKLDNTKSGVTVKVYIKALEEKKYLLPNSRLVPTFIREFNIGCSRMAVNKAFALPIEIRSVKSEIP